MSKTALQINICLLLRFSSVRNVNRTRLFHFMSTPPFLLWRLRRGGVCVVPTFRIRDVCSKAVTGLINVSESTSSLSIPWQYSQGTHFFSAPSCLCVSPGAPDRKYRPTHWEWGVNNIYVTASDRSWFWQLFWDLYSGLFTGMVQYVPGAAYGLNNPRLSSQIQDVDIMCIMDDYLYVYFIIYLHE